MADVAQASEPSEAIQTHAYRQQLREGEQHWMWKVALRAIIILINIIAIGCVAYVISVSAAIDANPYIYYFGFGEASVGSLVVLCVSLAWCVICLLYLFLRKPPRPVHPGWAVGVDLVLWLAFLAVGLIALAGVFGIVNFGSGGSIEDPSYGNSDYSGAYYLAPNNTWVYNITNVYNNGNQYYNYTTGTYQYTNPVSAANITRDCEPHFSTCAEQDSYINKVWHMKGTLEATEILVDAVLWLDLILHFILFVWACVDTQRRNNGKRGRREQLVADRIIRDLESKGLITVSNGMVVQRAPEQQPLMSQLGTAPTQQSQPSSTSAAGYYAPESDKITPSYR